jgi:hypothetical protein
MSKYLETVTGNQKEVREKRKENTFLKNIRIYETLYA